MTKEYDAYAITSEVFADMDDDTFHEAYQLLSGEGGLTEEEFREKAEILLELYKEDE